MPKESDSSYLTKTPGHQEGLYHFTTDCLFLVIPQTNLLEKKAEFHSPYARGNEIENNSFHSLQLSTASKGINRIVVFLVQRGRPKNLPKWCKLANGTETFSHEGAPLKMMVGIPSFARWWIQRLYIFAPTWGNDPIWLIFFGWVETTT